MLSRQFAPEIIVVYVSIHYQIVNIIFLIFLLFNHIAEVARINLKGCRAVRFLLKLQLIFHLVFFRPHYLLLIVNVLGRHPKFVRYVQPFIFWYTFVVVCQVDLSFWHCVDCQVHATEFPVQELNGLKYHFLLLDIIALNLIVVVNFIIYNNLKQISLIEVINDPREPIQLLYLDGVPLLALLSEQIDLTVIGNQKVQGGPLLPPVDLTDGAAEGDLLVAAPLLLPVELAPEVLGVQFELVHEYLLLHLLDF